MDLVILKVNGQDVTNSSHEDTLKIFKTAQEPITIEVIRMQPNKCKNTGDSNDLSINTIVNQQQVTPGTKRSSATTTSCTTGVQTDLSGFINVDDDDYFYNYFVYEDDVDGVNYEIAQEQDDEELDVDDREAVEINDYLSNSNNDDEYHQLETYKPEDVDDGSGGAGADDVYLEEITLRKSKSTENLGLTVSYNYDITDRNNPTDITAVAYISEIARDSLAARDGRLREGDQILRINGRDIVNKDQIDKIFYQTQNNIVNILISRCVGQNSPPPAPPSSTVSSSLNNIDEPPAAATVTASETDEHSPAYQNSMIELLMRQQKQFENSKNNKSLPNETNDDNSDNKILIPPQVPFHNNLPLSTSSLSSATPKNINKSFNKPSQHHSLTSNFKESLKKFEDLSINKKSVTGLVTSTSTVAALAAACHSDTEHIYETIPESDSEPIYSSPYESQYLPRTFELNQQQHVNQSKLSTKNSSSSIEEKDSSSAYNTGGESCNSNPLLLELYRSDRDGNDEGTMGLSSFDIGSTPTGAMTSIKSPVTLMSTAMNCRVKSSEVTPVTRSNSSSSSLSIVTSPRQPIPKSLLSQEDKKLLSEAHYHQQQQQQQQYHHNHNYRHQCHHHHHYHNYQNKIPAINPNCQLPQDDNRELAITNNRDDILYTNIDNNDSSKRTTMILQQEIFTQALNRKNFITNRSNTCESDREIRIKNSKSHGKFQAPNLTQYHFIGSSQQMQRNPANDDNAGGKCDPRMEWKVKRRPDGTRYIARRSVRNRLLGNRTLEIFEERAGQTTEDDTVSEIKLGRYWNKDERKRHIEHARQRKLRHQAAMPPPAPPTTLVAQQHFKLRRDFNCEHRADDSAVTAEATSTKELSKKLIQDAIMTHVNRIDDNHDDEDSVLGGGGGTAGDDDALTINGKLKGLLSVTTV